MDLKTAKELVVRAGKELVERKLIARTWGNVSCRIDEQSFVITPSGRDYLSLTAEDIVQVAIENLSYSGSLKPSSEKGAHAKIYQVKADANFVIHTHQLNASVVSALNLPGIPSRGKALMGSQVPVTGYGLPSTKKLAREIEKTALRMDGNAMVMKNHGALCFGADYQSAFDSAVALEQLSEAFLDDLKKQAPAQWGAGETSEPPEHWPDVLAELRRRFAYVEVEPSIDCLNAATFGKAVKPMVDDFAQIIGLSMPVVPADAKKISSAFKKSYCVLVEGVGAVCMGDDADDVSARQMIAAKTAKAQMYAGLVGKVKPINALESRLMNIIYTVKYSKQKAS